MQPAALPVVLRDVTLMVRADAQEALPALLARVIAVARAEQLLAPRETIRRLLLSPDPNAVAMLVDQSFTAGELNAMLGLRGSRLLAVSESDDEGTLLGRKRPRSGGEAGGMGPPVPAQPGGGEDEADESPPAKQARGGGRGRGRSAGRGRGRGRGRGQSSGRGAVSADAQVSAGAATPIPPSSTGEEGLPPGFVASPARGRGRGRGRGRSSDGGGSPSDDDEDADDDADADDRFDDPNGVGFGAAAAGGRGQVRGDLSCGGVPGMRVTPVYSTPEALTNVAYAANFDASTPPMLSLSRRVMFYMRHHDVVVDLHCGDSDWIHQMRSCVLSCNLTNVSFLAFGRTPPPPGRRYGYKPGDWSKLTADDFVPPAAQRAADSVSGAGGASHGAPPPPPEGPPAPERLVIGLCPPWGTAGTAAAEFVKRAAQLRPRLLILLMPGSVPLPKGYVLFDKHAHLFERPGEAEPPGGRGRGARTFFLLQRHDTTEKYKVRTETGKLMECWNPDPRHECWLPEGAQMAGPDDDDCGGGGGGAAAGMAVEENEYDALAREAAAPPPSFGAAGELSYHNLAPGGAAEEGGASRGVSASGGTEPDADATARRDDAQHPPQQEQQQQPPPQPQPQQPQFMSMPRSPQLNRQE